MTLIILCAIIGWAAGGWVSKKGWSPKECAVFTILALIAAAIDMTYLLINK